MALVPLDQQLHQTLLEIPEIEASGFTVRKGLTGVGVTVLHGRTYFGSWRVATDALVWVSANPSDSDYPADTVEEATRHTLLLILRSLERQGRPQSLRAAS